MAWRPINEAVLGFYWVRSPEDLTPEPWRYHGPDAGWTAMGCEPPAEMVYDLIEEGFEFWDEPLLPPL